MSRITTTKNENEYINVDLDLKVSQGIKLSKENINDLQNHVLKEPDNGWNYDDNIQAAHYIQHYKMQIGSNVYLFRVNLSYKLLTLLSIEKV